MVCSHAVVRVAQASQDFFAHSPALLPSLIAFLFAPQFALRSWIAVKALPGPVVLDDSELKRLTRRSKILLGFSLMAFIGAEVYLLQTASFSIIEYIITAFLGLAINTSLVVFIGRFTKCVRWSAHRSPMGMVVWKPAPGTVQKWKVVPLVFLATLLNVQLYQHGNAAIAFLASTALVYRFTSQAPIKKQSIRRVMLALLSWVFLTMVLVGVAIVVIIKSEGEIENQPEVEPSPFSRQFQHYGQSFLTAIYASGPGVLIAVCLRFDYSQHLNRTLLTETPLAIETIEAPVKPLHLTTGALLPRQTPSFSRPLYLTALLSWFISQISTLAVFRFVPMGELAKDAAAHDLVGLFFAVPIMVVSVCLVATTRGEFKDMWRYKEDWFVDTKALGQDVKSASEVEEAGEDVVPAYSDVVKEDELVAPAYALDVKVPL